MELLWQHNLNAVALFLQMAWASCMPMPIFVAVAVVVGLAVGMSIACVKGALAPDRSSQGVRNENTIYACLSHALLPTTQYLLRAPAFHDH